MAQARLAQSASLLQERSYLGQFAQLAYRAAPILIAVPMAIFGVQHFIYVSFVANFIPAWIPWRVFWACFTGVALIAAAAGIILKLCDRWAASLLGTMILLFVLLLHTSRIASQPSDFGEWRGIFQALVMSGCAFVLGGTIPRRAGDTVAPRTLAVLSELGARIAPWFIGIGIIALGLEHFIFAEVSAPQVPAWIQGTVMGNYISGAVLVACGVGICIRFTRRRSALILAIVVLMSLLLFHLPVVLRISRFESDWTKTLVISGGAILLARGSANGKRD